MQRINIFVLVSKNNICMLTFFLNSIFILQIKAGGKK